MPESRLKYLYERLGDHDFQLLTSALLTYRFPDFIPLPLRQSDGGRDGVIQGGPDKLIYQVKWSVKGTEKKPVDWLNAVVKSESHNLKRLASEGSKRYVLITNVPSTGAPGSGTFDKLNERLDEHAKAFGFEQMSCFWREAVDGMVDGAPREVKWAYAEMLAGWDLIRYLMDEDGHPGKDAHLRKLVRRVAAAQWDDDELVKFSQVDIDREKVADLFIDVHADRLTQDSRDPQRIRRDPLGGAAAYLLSDELRLAKRDFTLVRGAPGQGKSTLSQYVAQVHRSAFVPQAMRSENLPLHERPRFPVRMDLSDYARWMAGFDVWDPETDKPKKSKARTGAGATVEAFIAALMAHAAGGMRVDADAVHDLFETVPSIVILDGLDEVGKPTVRRRVVSEIDKFCARSRTADHPPQVIVTTRPSTNELPEPSPDRFDVVVLGPLEPKQREDYLRKWSAVRGIRGTAGRALRRSFRAKIAEPYIGELASNPMQLTILLDLLHKHGDAVPNQRTKLYDAYVEMLLIREANKHPESVRKHQDDLREIIPFLGWYLHAHTESDRVNNQMPVADLKATIGHFQRTYANPEDFVDEMFEAVSDRLWALTSKIEGSYEFEVLSLREYFAARFLYRYAGEDKRGFDRNDVLRELLRRPYWLNTARFYGGNAEVGDVSVLADGVIDELADNPPPQSVIAAWTLLTDGVFTTRPRRARDVLQAVCADVHCHVLLNALTRGDIRPLPDLPALPANEGHDPTWTRLTQEISADPASPLARPRVRVLRELLNQRTAFGAWWSTQAVKAQGAPSQLDAWLEIASECEAAAGQSVELPDADLARELVAQRILDTGLVPIPGSDFESSLVDAVFDGRCPNVNSVRSLPAQIAVAFGAEDFLSATKNGFSEVSDARRRKRQEAIRHLRSSEPALAAAAAERRFRAGQKNSTFPWSNVAAAVYDARGPSWLASCVAIFGAASPLNLGVTKKPGVDAFGPSSHPCALLDQTRAHASDAEWWLDQLAQLHETSPAHDRALSEWALALWCVADPEVFGNHLPVWEDVMSKLPAARRRSVVDAAFRTSAHGWVQPCASPRTSTDATLSFLLEARNPGPRKEVGNGTYVPHERGPELRGLLEVARSDRWFKVDSVGTYR